MALMSQLFASTHRNIRPRVTDTFYKASPLMRRLKAAGSVRVKGGRTIIEPLAVNEPSGGPYVGLETFAATDNEELSGAEFPWVSYRRLPAISGMDDFKNSGDGAIVDLWNTKCELAGMGITDDVISDILGDPTTADLTRVVVPFEQIASDGTTYTVGGLTSADAPLWQGNVTDLSAAVIVLADIEGLDLNCSEGSEMPSDYGTTKVVYKNVWRLMQTNQRYVGEDKNVGFKNFTFNDALFHFDSHILTTGGGFTGNRIYAFNMKHLRLYIGKGKEFLFEDKTPTNADGLVASIKLYCQFGTSARRYQGVLHNFVFV